VTRRAFLLHICVNMRFFLLQRSPAARGGAQRKIKQSRKERRKRRARKRGKGEKIKRGNGVLLTLRTWLLPRFGCKGFRLPDFISDGNIRPPRGYQAESESTN